MATKMVKATKMVVKKKKKMFTDAQIVGLCAASINLKKNKKGEYWVEQHDTEGYAVSSKPYNPLVHGDQALDLVKTFQMNVVWYRSNEIYAQLSAPNELGLETGKNRFTVMDSDVNRAIARCVANMYHALIKVWKIKKKSK
jgi:hypothetical protein